MTACQMTPLVSHLHSTVMHQQAGRCLANTYLCFLRCKLRWCAAKSCLQSLHKASCAALTRAITVSSHDSGLPSELLT